MIRLGGPYPVCPEEGSAMLATAIAEKNPYEVALENFDLAADALNLEENVRAMIKYPERILCVSVPVRMDTGRIVRFEGL